MPLLLMMIGIPGSGKSTWARNYLDHVEEGVPYVVISTDDYVERKAQEEGKTYTEVFNKYYSEAEKACIEQLKFAIEANANIIWDQTNLTKKTRAKKLTMVPEQYSKYACYFATPGEEELKKRLANRPGKHIPDHVIKSMAQTLEPPTIEEGFNGFAHGLVTS